MSGAALVLATGINWTAVIVTGIPAIVGALCSGAALVLVSLNRRALRTPSGSSVGTMVERTHHLSEVNAVRSARIDRAVNGETVPPDDEEGG